MTTLQHPADTRVIPEWELCDRLRRSMRLVPGLDNHDVAEFLGCGSAPSARPVLRILGGGALPGRPRPVVVNVDFTAYRLGA